MLRRPPRSTRTDTLFPYTTLFRSSGIGGIFGGGDFDPPQLGGCRSGRSQIAPIEGQSDDRSCQHRQPAQEIGEQEDENRNAPVDHVLPLGVATQDGGEVDATLEDELVVCSLPFRKPVKRGHQKRSEERRVGQECGSTCRSRWARYH